MIPHFFKFPSTPHLAALSDMSIRGDKVLSHEECVSFLEHDLVVEEKIDGANLGISFDASGSIKIQNRGEFITLPGNGQWKIIDQWLTPRMESLFDNLSDRYILFGEWCYAQHSVFYNKLPDWFIGFDLFDKEKEKFISCKRRDELLKKIGIAQVPILKRGHCSLPELKSMISVSKFSDTEAEGIYLRYDYGDWLSKRAKLVRPTFIQSIDQHWSRSGIKPNKLH